MHFGKPRCTTSIPRMLIKEKLEEVTPPSQSTGEVSVISGSGTHPPLDVPAARWGVTLQAADEHRVGRQEALKVLFSAPNYSTVSFSEAYNLETFSVDDTQRAVSEALNSPASVHRMSKKHTTPLVNDPGMRTLREEMLAQRGFSGRGESLVKTMASGDATGFWEEGVTEVRDKAVKSACSHCGNPRHLKKCGGCQAKLYCSDSCLKVRLFQVASYRSFYSFEYRPLGRRDTSMSAQVAGRRPRAVVRLCRCLVAPKLHSSSRGSSREICLVYYDREDRRLHIIF